MNSDESLAKQQKFECEVCQMEILVFPPGDEYIEIIEEACPEGDSKEFKATCPKKHENTKHWHKKKHS